MVRAPVEIGPAGGQDTRPVTAEVPAPGPPAARAADLTAITRQLGRVPRGLLGVAHRCPCGLPDVVQTAPRLPDGTPFPTLYYLTCPRAVAAVGPPAGGRAVGGGGNGARGGARARAGPRGGGPRAPGPA